MTNYLFIKNNRKKLSNDVQKILKDSEPNKIKECIDKTKIILKKEHSDWSEIMIEEVAKKKCGRKTSVQIKNDSKDDCISKKISIVAKEHPEWKHNQVIAVAHSYCKKTKTKDILKQFDSTKSSFDKYLFDRGFKQIYDRSTTCYKMENLEETDTEYIVDVVLAKAMVQNYPQKGLVMAKLPSELERAICVDYESGDEIERLPTFEYHPDKEERDLENGYIENIRYQKDKMRIVGRLHVIKDKLSKNLDGYFKRREMIGVSIGFLYSEGDGGTFQLEDDESNGKSYDVSQENLMLTHLALLPPNDSTGRCPMPYCGTGITLDVDKRLDEKQNIQIKELRFLIKKNNEKINNMISKIRQLYLLGLQKIRL